MWMRWQFCRRLHVGVEVQVGDVLVVFVVVDVGQMRKNRKRIKEEVKDCREPVHVSGSWARFVEANFLSIPLLLLSFHVPPRFGN